jgi:hypothetical protein
MEIDGDTGENIMPGNCTFKPWGVSVALGIFGFAVQPFLRGMLASFPRKELGAHRKP